MTTAMHAEQYADRHRQFAADDLPPLLAERAEPGVIADLGCGDGAVLAALATRGLLGATTYAVDISPERVQRAAAAVPGVKPIVADAANVEALADGALDGAIASQLIEHMSDDHGLMREIARLLRPGGWWYVGTVLRLKRAWWIYRVDGVWRLDPTHVREYESEDDVHAALRHESLTTDRVRIEPLTYPVSDLVLRAAARTPWFDREKVAGAYRSEPLRALRRLRVRVPGYFLVEACGHKR